MMQTMQTTINAEPLQPIPPKPKRNTSAGLMMYKIVGDEIQVFLLHPGGPLWTDKDEGAWTIPKGLIEEGEDIYVAAHREFQEETGIEPPGNPDFYVNLGMIVQRSGKHVYCWAFEGDFSGQISSNTFTMDGVEYPECDRGEFFTIAQAEKKINPMQFDLILRLAYRLAGRGESILSTL